MRGEVVKGGGEIGVPKFQRSYRGGESIHFRGIGVVVLQRNKGRRGSEKIRSV